MKACCKCKADKPLIEFSKDKSRKDGFAPRCKPCAKAAVETWRSSDPEHALAAGRRRQAAYYQRDPERRIEAVKCYQKNNPDKVKACNANWRMNNPQTSRTGQNRRSSTYRQANPDKIAARAAARRATLLSQTIPLAAEHELAIKRLYAFAKYISEKTKIPHHVDHIVPLQGKEMMGLHVPWNLQVIAASNNLAKSNKIDYSRALPTCMDRVYARD